MVAENIAEIVGFEVDDLNPHRLHLLSPSGKVVASYELASIKTSEGEDSQLSLRQPSLKAGSVSYLLASRLQQPGQEVITIGASWRRELTTCLSPSVIENACPKCGHAGEHALGTSCDPIERRTLTFDPELGRYV